VIRSAEFIPLCEDVDAISRNEFRASKNLRCAPSMPAFPTVSGGAFADGRISVFWSADILVGLVVDVGAKADKNVGAPFAPVA
jgi:hypothetical protein